MAKAPLQLSWLQPSVTWDGYLLPKPPIISQNLLLCCTSHFWHLISWTLTASPLKWDRCSPLKCELLSLWPSTYKFWHGAYFVNGLGLKVTQQITFLQGGSAAEFDFVILFSWSVGKLKRLIPSNTGRSSDHIDWQSYVRTSPSSPVQGNVWNYHFVASRIFHSESAK